MNLVKIIWNNSETESSRTEVLNTNDEVSSHFGLFLKNTCSNHLDFYMNPKLSMDLGYIKEKLKEP